MSIAIPKREKVQSETDVVGSIRSALMRLGWCRIMRNNNGALRDETGRLVIYGLGEGSADLVGYVQTPNGARFFALEVKRPEQRVGGKRVRGGVLTEEQISWIDTVNAEGGYAASVDSAEAGVRHAYAARGGASIAALRVNKW